MIIPSHHKVAGVLMIAAFIIPGRIVDSLNTPPSPINNDERAITELKNLSHPLNENLLSSLEQEKVDTLWIVLIPC